MVGVEQGMSTDDHWVILRPNIAVNWRQTLAVFGLMAAVSLATALFFTFIGYWPVLPFAVAEIGLLGWALYVSAHRASECEVVIIGDDRIEVRKGRRRPEASWTLPTPWTEVVLEPARHRWYSGRLLLRSHGVAVELGRFLNEEERASLAHQLRRWVGPMGGMGERT